MDHIQILLSDWIENKKAIINTISKKDHKCFQYAVTSVALNHEEIGKNPERITKIKPLLCKYNWKGINFPSEKNDWKKIEKNNTTIALNILCPKKETFILFMVQYITQIVKNKLFF